MKLSEMSRDELLREYFSASDDYMGITPGATSSMYGRGVSPQSMAIENRLHAVIEELDRRRKAKN